MEIEQEAVIDYQCKKLLERSKESLDSDDNILPDRYMIKNTKVPHENNTSLFDMKSLSFNEHKITTTTSTTKEEVMTKNNKKSKSNLEVMDGEKKEETKNWVDVSVDMNNEDLADLMRPAAIHPSVQNMIGNKIGLYISDRIVYSQNLARGVD